jgi:hypothetical protein
VGHLVSIGVRVRICAGIVRASNRSPIRSTVSGRQMRLRTADLATAVSNLGRAGCLDLRRQSTCPLKPIRWRTPLLELTIHPQTALGDDLTTSVADRPRLSPLRNPRSTKHVTHQLGARVIGHAGRRLVSVRLGTAGLPVPAVLDQIAPLMRSPSQPSERRSSTCRAKPSSAARQWRWLPRRDWAAHGACGVPAAGR